MSPQSHVGFPQFSKGAVTGMTDSARTVRRCSRMLTLARKKVKNGNSSPIRKTSSPVDQFIIRYGPRFELNDCVGRRKSHGGSAPRKDIPFRSHELDKDTVRRANCFVDGSLFVFHHLRFLKKARVMERDMDVRAGRFWRAVVTEERCGRESRGRHLVRRRRRKRTEGGGYEQGRAA